MKRILRITLASIIAFGLTPALSQAHFPFLLRGDQGKLLYYFGDDVGEQDYEMPETILESTLEEIQPDGTVVPVETVVINTEEFKGRATEGAVKKNSTYLARATYGLFRGGLLNYTALHLNAPLKNERQEAKQGATQPKVFAEIVDTDKGIDVYAIKDGQPLAKVNVSLYDEEGSLKGKGETDESGKVSFEDSLLDQGVMALMFGSTDEVKGEYNGKPYEKSSNYLTVTFLAPNPTVPSELASAPDLPFGLTSFGAARTKDAIYVYGGNIGSAHDYYEGTQSNKLLKLSLTDPNAQWTEVATGDQVQGLGMVAYKNDVIVIGGFKALNPEGEKANLQSQASVKAYDTVAGTWRDLPSLPEPRSSHDAALLGDTIYVVGGWELGGPSNQGWHKTAWALDLSAEKPEWKLIAEPPFTKRALAVVAHKDKLFAIGGMAKEGGPSKTVWTYNPKNQTWKEIAPLIGDNGMAGFGATGWSENGKLIVSTQEGNLEKWNDDESHWKLIGRTEGARFFHRVLPLGENVLVTIGGVNMGEGEKFLNLEAVAIKP